MVPSLPIQLPARKAALAASAATATLLAALFADRRYGLSYDINQLLQDKAFRKRFAERIQTLGKDVSLYHMLELADPKAEALWFEGRCWTYSELILETNKLASFLRKLGVTAGDAVAVFAINSPEMVVAIAAVSKLGAVPALINSALRTQTLEHCLNLARASLVICTPDLAPAIAELGTLVQKLSTFSLSLSSFPPLQLDPDACAAANISQLRYEDLAAIAPDNGTPATRLLKDVGALVYTSGTSGKPKAVAVKNFLLVLVSTPLTIDLRKARMYQPLRTFSCLPLFHATCLFCGLYYSAGMSGTLCLARKFSASRFTSQLVESGATRMLYVGELCRYLLSAPKSTNDRAHKCIVATGNGLNRDVWIKFKARFGIPEIREVYRSTEGVAKFDNFTRGAAGAGMVGFAGPIKLYSEDDTFLVRYDPSAESVYRDPKTGFCVLAKAGEPGEAIGRIRSTDFLNNYHNDDAATQLKLVRNVFQKGDLFQRTGDLLVRHHNGWVRFHDRSGDTFRWRGENVSAGEVRDHISKLSNVQNCSVYAVKLEGYDGQAGAAAITLDDPSQEGDFASRLYQKLRSSGLALYQLPRLVRFRKQIETTATFKQSNTALKGLPWNPEAENQQDSVYWLCGEKYTKLDLSAWSEIEQGKARL